MLIRDDSLTIADSPTHLGFVFIPCQLPPGNFEGLEKTVHWDFDATPSLLFYICKSCTTESNPTTWREQSHLNLSRISVTEVFPIRKDSNIISFTT